MFGAESEQAVEDNQIEWTCFGLSWTERTLVCLKRLQFFTRELGAFFFWKNQAQIDFPAGLLETFGGDNCVAAVMAFPDEDHGATGPRKKFPDGRSDSRTGAIHQRLHFGPPRECRLLGRSHGGGAHDRRFQLILRALVVLLLLRRALPV